MSGGEISEDKIYAQNLLSKKGFAPWMPGPVNIAEVGYVLDGGWVPLFDASKERGNKSDEELDVPKGYYPLVVGNVRRQILCGGIPITSERGTARNFGAKLASSSMGVTQGSAQYTFKASKQEGAILVPGGDIDIENALERASFQTYIKKNYRSWLEFANGRHNRDIRLIDLVLVTGCHKTSSWACATFAQDSSEVNLKFSINAEGAMQDTLWGKWEWKFSPGVWAHSGPKAIAPEKTHSENLASSPQSDEETIGSNSSSDMNLLPQQMEGIFKWCAAEVKERESTTTRNQGVFIRGYKICDRHTGLARLFFRRNCLKCGNDGFTLIPTYNEEVTCESGEVNNSTGSNGDGDTEGGPSGSRQDHPSGSSDNSPSSSSGNGGARFGTSRRSDGGSGQSDSSHTPSSEVDLDIDEDLELYLQLNVDKTPSPLDIILEYILENSTAELALAHDDDVAALLRDEDVPEDFAVEIRKVRPRIFVVDQVGMLYKTYLASLDDWPGVQQEMSPAESRHESLFDWDDRRMNVTGDEHASQSSSRDVLDTIAGSSLWDKWPIHHIVRLDTGTSNESLVMYIVDDKTQGARSLLCGWPGCKHAGFTRKAQAISHIRSMHLEERLFACVACNASFKRHGDALRHAATKNHGRIYACHKCHKMYARRDIREAHEKRCVLKALE